MFSLKEIIATLRRLSTSQDQPTTVTITAGSGPRTYSRTYPVHWAKTSYGKTLMLQEIVTTGVDIAIMPLAGDDEPLVQLTIPEIGIELIGRYDPSGTLSFHQRT